MFCCFVSICLPQRVKDICSSEANEPATILPLLVAKRTVKDLSQHLIAVELSRTALALFRHQKSSDGFVWKNTKRHYMVVLFFEDEFVTHIKHTQMRAHTQMHTQMHTHS